MRKNELLSMKKLLVTPDMIKAAKEDKYEEHSRQYKNYFNETHTEKWKQYTYYLFFRAVVENEILKVSVFTRKWIVSGNKNPQYDIYISKSEDKWLVYDNEEQKWRSAKIDYLHYDTGQKSYIYDVKNYQSKETRKNVNEYLGTGNMDVKEAVLEFQCKVRGEQLSRKHRSELEHIDAVMNEVPDLPKDFNQWIKSKGFICHEYLLYQREKPHRWPKVYCTHCKTWSDAPGMPEHNKDTVCPACKTAVKYKSWNKQKYLNEDETVGIVQKLNDGTGYILRRFQCKLKRNHEKGWQDVELTMYEDVRVRLGVYFTESELFEYGEYKYSGVNRWCHECRRSGWDYYSRGFGRAVMYTRNLKRELKAETFGKMNLKKLFSGDTGEAVSPSYLLQRLYQYPCLEYLQKSGLNNLVDEIMNAKEDKKLFESEAIKLTDFLKVDKQHFNRLRELDGNCNVLRALQYEQKTGNKVSKENLEQILALKININDLEMDRTKMSLCKTLNFLLRQQELNGQTFTGIKRYFKDYLDMAAERGMDLTDEIVCKNSRMMEYHDRYLEEKNRIENKKRDKEVNQKFEKIKQDYEKNKNHFEWAKDGYTVIVPKKASDITKEGRVQHHCVGASDTYMRNMNNGASYILFLRKEKSPGRAYYTLQVNWQGKIMQAYAAYDRKPNYETVEKVLTKWTSEIQKRIKKESKEEKIELQIVAV